MAARASRPGELLRVRVQPRASGNAIIGWREDGVLSVRVTAAPVAGAANAAVGAILAASLGVPASAVAIVHGERGRDKLVRVTGLTPAEIRRRLGRRA